VEHTLDILEPAQTVVSGEASLAYLGEGLAAQARCVWPAGVRYLLVLASAVAVLEEAALTMLVAGVAGLRQAVELGRKQANNNEKMGLEEFLDQMAQQAQAGEIQEVQIFVDVVVAKAASLHRRAVEMDEQRVVKTHDPQEL